MENQIEKSIEQIALENYAKKELDEKYERIGIFTGIIVGILSAISFFWMAINSQTCLHDYVMFIFVALLIGGIIGMFAMACVVMFSLISRRDEKNIEKSISLLSNKERKKIISDYLQKEIGSLQENIPYCEKKIEKLQLEIEELKDSIEKSNQRIPELQEKLKTFKTKNYENGKLFI